MGALKYTNEGIHGPEIQFLGRSLPVTTGIVPFAGAVLGAATGARLGGDKPIRRGLAGGVAGLIGGNVVGSIKVKVLKVHVFAKWLEHIVHLKH